MAEYKQEWVTTDVIHINGEPRSFRFSATVVFDDTRAALENFTISPREGLTPEQLEIVERRGRLALAEIGLRDAVFGDDIEA